MLKGKKSRLQSLETGNKVSNKVMKDDLKTDEKIQAEVNKYSGDHALNFWLRNNGSKKP